MSVSFTPPGPGFWELDRSHYPGGTTPVIQALTTESVEDAYRKEWPLLGVPAETVSMRFVNGFSYTRLRPLIAPDKPSEKAPPTLVLKIASRLHPEFRRRRSAAAKSLEASRSPEVIAQWHAEIRPRLVAANLAAQDVDLPSLSDAALANHVEGLIGHLRATNEEHHRLHCYDLGPIGHLLLACRGWGIAGSEAVAMLAGASPSTSEPRQAAAEINALLTEAGAMPATLSEARAISPEIDASIGAYLRRHGGVLYSGYDLDSPTLGEAPDVVLATILGSTLDDIAATERQAEASAGTATEQLRTRVPVDEHEHFDRLLADAREAMDLRDDNGPVTYEWPTGLLRLSMLEAGRRLAPSDRLSEADHIFELDRTELPAVLRGNPTPTAETINSRATQRAAFKQLDPPKTLGDPEAAPPMEALPTELSTVVQMIEVVLQEMGLADVVDDPASGLAGTGVGTSVIVGRARVAETAEDAFDLIEDGDILVTRVTSPSYNLVLSLVDGLVTSEGGPMSHAAVLSRELGISAIVGASSAMTAISDGDQIEIDPIAGTVQVLSTR